MHLVGVFLVSLVALSSSTVIPVKENLFSLLDGIEIYNDLIPSFVDFAIKFNKTYKDDAEMLYRLSVFKYGVEEANKLNERARSLGSTATYGITMFSDITPEEFKSNYLMKDMPPISKDVLYPNNLEPESTIAHLKDVGAPSSFDWTSVSGAETGVYNQGTCGSCWAFSATENHESRYALQHNSAAESMSVQQILDCDEPSEHGCNGGWPYLAWTYIYYQGGQDDSSCYPYVGEVESTCNWNAGCNDGSLVSWTWIYPGDENNMLLWLWGNAPISICLDASQWAYYTSGIVLSSECSQVMDHCVLLSGYNVNSNPPYWNVRNSWGTSWGMNGFIYLQYGANTCGLAVYPASCHTVSGENRKMIPDMMR